MSFASGTRLGHHEIVDTLGEGGMGQVYRALDTTLGRQVALKVLPPDLAHDPSRIDRFRREARTVAALNHPHIVTIYSVESDAATGMHFLTMELVEGESLDRQLPPAGLPVATLLDLARALADALAAAHGKGIVHRDLKPGNIMMTADGRVKVLDFGLAKSSQAAGPARGDAETIARTMAGVVTRGPTSSRWVSCSTRRPPARGRSGVPAMRRCCRPSCATRRRRSPRSGPICLTRWDVSSRASWRRIATAASRRQKPCAKRSKRLGGRSHPALARGRQPGRQPSSQPPARLRPPRRPHAAAARSSFCRSPT